MYVNNDDNLLLNVSIHAVHGRAMNGFDEEHEKKRLVYN